MMHDSRKRILALLQGEGFEHEMSLPLHTIKVERIELLPSRSPRMAFRRKVLLYPENENKWLFVQVAVAP